MQYFLSLQYWRQMYLVTVLAMILAVFFAQIHPHYLSKQWKQLRSLIFCSVAGYGLVPTAHWIFITGGFSSELVQVREVMLGTHGSHTICSMSCNLWSVISSLFFQAFIPRVLVMYFIAALALIFYVSKVPERYFPGEILVMFSSHIFWNVCVCIRPFNQQLCPYRSAQLPGLQPPGVAPAAGADVLLVASVVGFHHGVQTQPALLRGTPAHLVCPVTQ